MTAHDCFIKVFTLTPKSVKAFGASFQLVLQHPGLDLKHFGFDQESAAVAVFTGLCHQRYDPAGVMIEAAVIM